MTAATFRIIGKATVAQVPLLCELIFDMRNLGQDYAINIGNSKQQSERSLILDELLDG